MTQGQIKTRAGYEGPRPGERVLPSDVPDFPVGTVLVRQKQQSRRWVKGEGGSWFSMSSGQNRTVSDMQGFVSSYTTVVESLPGALGETAEQWEWRFRDMAIYGAERAFGDPDVALRVLNEMELEFRPTPGLKITNQHDRACLPKGTRVYSGTLSKPEEWVKGDYQRWEAATSRMSNPPQYSDSITVVALPGIDGEVTEPDEWVVATPGPDEQQRLAKARARAWEFAFAEKIKRRWCADFERAMLKCGLSAAAVVEPLLGGYRIGDTVSPEQAATLGLGALLSTPDEQAETGFAIFERVEKSTNRFGLRRVAGWDVPAHYAKRMVVRGVRSESVQMMPYRCWSEEFMHALPVGSVIGEGNRPQYIKMLQPVRSVDECWGSIAYFDAPNETVLGGGMPRYNHRAFMPGDSCIYQVVRFGPRSKGEEKG